MAVGRVGHREYAFISLKRIGGIMVSGGVILGDIDMYASEIASGELVMPFDAVTEDGYGYYLKLNADDLSDPAISVFRSWLIASFAALRDKD